VKAIVYDRYGGAEVLRAEEVEAPVAGEDEVLIRVHASSVNTADWFFLTASPWIIRPMAGLFRPKQRILGRDVAGVVEAVGKRVTRLSPGDEVYGEIDGGAFAELAVAGEDQVVPKPENLTFEQAAAMPLAGTTALRGVRDSGKVEPGQRVLVNGASGAVGTFTVQIAKSFGAEVTAVCRGRNEEMVRSLGADRVVDYEREDFTKDETRYDV
jgi:NADPH:quinone reductase-like Zn-dependent oxidoreductase